MGWGRMLLLGNVGQQLDISDLNNEIVGMQNAFAQKGDLDREQGQSIEHLHKENHDLKLYLATLIYFFVGRPKGKTPCLRWQRCDAML